MIIKDQKLNPTVSDFDVEIDKSFIFGEIRSETRQRFEYTILVLLQYGL
jgi:hypothetical protein